MSFTKLDLAQEQFFEALMFYIMKDTPFVNMGFHQVLKGFISE
jgi:hypothetical protein